MDTKERFIKSLEGTSHLLLIFLSLSWAYFFFLILKNGEISCGEPNKVWLICEFLLSLSVAGLGIFSFVRFLKNNIDR